MKKRQRSMRMLACLAILLMSLGDGRVLADIRGGTVMDRDLVRNGGFDQDKTAWSTNPTGTHVGAGYGKNGMGMQIWPEFSDNYGYILQELYLPAHTTEATLAFDYKFLPQPSASLGWFRARIVTESEDLAAALFIDPSTYPGEAWQMVDYTLTSGELSALNAAREAGKHVYLMIDLYAQFLYVNTDNVSFNVTGTMEDVDSTGSIAYVGLDASGYPRRVKRVDPDGSVSQTLWTHPSSAPATNSIYDVAWKPDASEVAFSSNHESGFSAFHSDVYGIRPDGSGLRRITNPPSKAEIEAGGYEWGTVTGQVHNNYGYVTSFQLYVEGASNAVSLNVGSLGSDVSFTVPNVADLGTGLQYVVFTWSDGEHANCKEYAAAVVDVTPGGTVDTGSLIFSGTCGTYDSESISWKRDGSEIGVDVITPRRFQATGEAIGTDLFSAPLTAGKLAWSPVDERILYRNWLIGGESGIYLTAEGDGTGSWLVDDGGATWVTPAWLPDGSGFVFTIDNYLYEYALPGGQITALATFYNEIVDNPSVSPDGQYVVFERQTTGVTPIQYDLWILSRANPVAMWPATDDGRSQNPDWGRPAPEMNHRIYLPVILLG